MKVKSKFIKPGNLPPNLGVNATIVYLLALDYWKAPGWLWSVVITFLAIRLVSAFYKAVSGDSTDIFED